MRAKIERWAASHRLDVVPTTHLWRLPPILAQAGAEAWRHAVECFTVHIRNPNTRAAYSRAVISFFR